MKSISHPRYQSGISLLVALVALVLMSLAGIALIRLVDSNALATSNNAFQQSARESTDASVEAARTWIMTPGNDLTQDKPGNGYYATYTKQILDFTGNHPNLANRKTITWPNGGPTGTDPIQPKCLAQDTSDVTPCYIIQRMCDKEGDPTFGTCDQMLSPGGLGTAGGAGSNVNSRQDLILGPRAAASANGPDGNTGLAAGSVVYRITVRASGPRGNVKYVQALIAG
jgi:Tfp pilus assembly protein PilX